MHNKTYECLFSSLIGSALFAIDVSCIQQHPNDKTQRCSESVKFQNLILISKKGMLTIYVGLINS